MQPSAHDPGPAPPRRALGTALACSVPAWLLLGLLAWGHLPFLSDDALISLRYADRLLDGQGLTWTDGERVEGYSNLLWVLLSAALGALGLDLVVAARVLGSAASAALLFVLVRAVAGAGPRGVPAAICASVGLALCSPFSVWTVGGLETTLGAALLVWAAVACYPLLEGRGTAWGAGVPLALLCWTRPEGLLVACGVAAGIVIARRGALAPALRVLILPSAAAVAQLAFRLVYYDAWLPNPVLAKVGPGLRRAIEGLEYLGAGALWSAGLLAPALLLGALALARPGRSRRRVVFLAVPGALWCAFVVAVGGDSFPARRFLVPALALAALVLGEGLVALGAARRGARRAGWVAAVLGLLALAVLQPRDPETLRAARERWEWDGAIVGRLLARAFADAQPLLAVDPAGTLPYFSRLPALDMLGLNDRHIARHRPPDFGRGPLGHELGDGAYVLDREPDLIVFCGPLGGPRPCFRSGRELVRDPRFRERYRLVTLEGGDPTAVRAQPWVRAEGGRVGIRREPGRVEVPGLFFMATGNSVARPDGAGRLLVGIDDATPAGLAGLRLAPGRWRLRTRADGGAVRVYVHHGGMGQDLAEGAAEVEFELLPGGPDAVDLLVTVAEAGGTARLRAVELERLGD